MTAAELQRTTALREANRIRTYRAQLKPKVKAGVVAAEELLRDPEPELHSMRVFDLLMAMPSTGRARSNAMLRRARVSPSKTIGGLSERQRVELLALLVLRSAA